MGILDRIIKQEINGQSPARVAEEERWQQEMERQQAEADYMASMGMSSVGQPLPPSKPFQLPPTFEKETMELYLKPRLPRSLNRLEGYDRFWIYTDEGSLTNTITSNDNGDGVNRKLTNLLISLDFQGCDNCDNLIQDHMLMSHAEIIHNKSRSDFNDGVRERLSPNVGISLAGNYPEVRNTGERPHDSRMGWLIGGRK